MPAPQIRDQTRQREGHQLTVAESVVAVTEFLATALTGARVAEVGITQFVFPFVSFIHEAHGRQFRLLIAHELHEWTVTPTVVSESNSEAAIQLARLAPLLQHEVQSVHFRASPSLEISFVDGLTLCLKGTSLTEPWELRETTRDVLDGGLLIVNTGEQGNSVWNGMPTSA